MKYCSQARTLRRYIRHPFGRFLCALGIGLVLWLFILVCITGGNWKVFTYQLSQGWTLWWCVMPTCVAFMLW